MSEPFVPKTTRLIGRNQFVEAIKSAIDDVENCHIIYLTGVGGIGKTRLLEEVPVLAENPKRMAFLWSGIIDLYHADNHSAEGIHKAIIDAIDPDKEYFSVYRAEREIYDRLLEKGVTGRSVQDSREKLDELFLADYLKIAEEHRIVLSFDTLELIQYEHDLVQKLCNVEDEPTLIKNWFVANIGRFPNTVTLFAGRKRPRVLTEFEAAFSGKPCHFQHMHVPGLSDEEFDNYLADILAQRGVQDNLTAALNEPELRTQIKQLASAGDDEIGVRPIRLSLILDLLAQGKAIPELSTENIDEELVRRLIEIQNPIGNAIYWLLYARKGLDKPLLQQLEPDWTDERVTEALNLLRSFSFVKTYQGAAHILFAHDDLYDTLDRYFKNDPNHLNAFTPICEYYRVYEPQAKTLQDRERYRVARLYYELLLDVREGYHRYYARWDEEAILNHESGFDMRLRDEVLRFLNRYALDESSPYFNPAIAAGVQEESIHRDCAVRWVKRHTARNKLEKAARIAENIRYNKNPMFDWKTLGGNAPLYKAGLLTAWSETLYYRSEVPADNIDQLLDKAISILKDWQPNNDVAQENNRWWRARILGRAHNNKGYLHRIQGHYVRALEQYRFGLQQFDKAKIDNEFATTSNNMAYLLALVGRIRAARYHIKRALAIRKNLLVPRSYQIALSLNTEGLIHTFDDHPVWGVRKCSEALELFNEAGEARGQGLAHTALGFAYRKQGEQWKKGIDSAQEAETSYSNAKIHLEEALKIFSRDVNEPVRLWESYNELGSLYCDWAYMVRREFKGDDRAIEFYELSIEYQEKALEIADKYDYATQAIDSLDDLAQAWSDRGFMYAIDLDNEVEASNCWDQADEILIRAIERIPDQFKLQENRGFESDLARGEMYVQLLGKMHLQFGAWYFDAAELSRFDDEEPALYDAGMREFAMSVAYFQNFWPQSHGFANMLDATMSRLGRGKLSAEQAKEIVAEVENVYRIDLSILKQRIDDTLGMPYA